MKNQNDSNIYCGCNPSVLDGTEHIVNIDEKIELPDEFSLLYAMPPVRNQGSTSTCVCQSLTGMLDFYHNSLVNTPNLCNRYSISELYNIRANKKVEGMSIKEGMSYLKNHGLNSQKINGYAKIPSIDALKHCLVMFGPCAGGMKCYNGDILHFWRKGGKFCGGHCVTFVGYTKSGIIIRNSWGYEWGINGYYEISYLEFSDGCFESWTFTI